MIVLYKLVNYATGRLGPSIDQVKTSKDDVAFFSKGREFLTSDVTRQAFAYTFIPQLVSFSVRMNSLMSRKSAFGMAHFGKPQANIGL